VAKLSLHSDQEAVLEKARQAFRDGHTRVLLYGATGFGKSLRKGTLVIMADGTLKAIEDVRAGDQLLGPDGGVRNVLSLGRGRETMYEVKPVKGDPYYVNASHILSLRKTGVDGLTLADGTRIPRDADVVNVNVETLAQSNKTARHCLKGWRAPAVQFHRPPQELPVDPYILGIWLGDGSSAGPTIHKPNGPMVEEWKRYGASLGLETYEYKNRGKDCSAWRLAWPEEDRSKPNSARVALQSLGVIGNKHIPDAYRLGTVDQRLRLIAGLLDSDGHSIRRGGYDWISKCERMARDFVFVCRSVGLAAYLCECVKGIKARGFSGTYWRVSVSGDCDKIPCLAKKSLPRQQIKRHLVTGLTLTRLGIEDYYGVVLDGDHLFMLGDFTVTHNTECAISMLQATADKGNRAAMILDRIVLCNQTSGRLDKYGIDHGVMQAGHWRWRPHERVQVCSAQTLEKRGAFPGLNLLVVDECHAQRKQTIEFIKNHPHIRVIGLSASPFANGLGNTYTTVVSATTTAELVKAGRLVPLRVFIAKEIDMSGAKKVAGEWSQDDAAERGMKITGDVVAEWAAKTMQVYGKPVKTIVFCSNIAHGADLAQKFAEAGYNFVPISYKDTDEFKTDAVRDFSRPDTSINGLIACDILTKGFDVADVMCGVSARPFTKSFMSHVQQMGRVMRSHPGKESALWLDHSGNYLRFQEDWDELFHEGVSELKDGKEKPKKEKSTEEKKAAKCPKCGSLWVGKGLTCSHCGFTRPMFNTVDNVAGEMVELKGGAAVPKETKQAWYSQLMTIAESRGYSSGWTAHKFREKWGVWPRNMQDVPAPVTPEVAKWEQSRRIAWAKGKGATLKEQSAIGNAILRSSTDGLSK
jgi:DNA repair protein RadD